jgi:hypothetical protein
MNENVCFDEGRQQKIVRVEKNDIFARTCFEPLFRGKALTAIVASPQYFRARILF